MKIHLGLVVLLAGGLLLGACGSESLPPTAPGDEPAQAPGAAASALPEASEPTQEALADVLRAMLAALEAGDNGAALDLLLPPSGMSVEAGRKAVGTFIEKREISAAGIDRLAAEGQFGKLDAVFAEDGAAWAKRAGVDAANCYALSLDDAQVAAFWDGTTFKVLRIDDVGKL